MQSHAQHIRSPRSLHPTNPSRNPALTPPAMANADAPLAVSNLCRLFMSVWRPRVQPADTDMAIKRSRFIRRVYEVQIRCGCGCGWGTGISAFGKAANGAWCWMSTELFKSFTEETEQRIPWND